MGEGGEGGVPGSFPIVFVYAASCEGHVSDPSLASYKPDTELSSTLDDNNLSLW